MKTVAKPKVFISYTWRPDNPSDPIDNPQARMLKLADRLRAAGLDCRIDQYFLLSLHGCVKPQRSPGDKVEPWVTWAGEQIKDADFVLLVCSAEYAVNVCKSPFGGDLTWEQWHALSDDLKFRLQEYQMDEQTGKKDKLPYAWWDWHFMIQDMEFLAGNDPGNQQHAGAYGQSDQQGVMGMTTSPSGTGVFGGGLNPEGNHIGVFDATSGFSTFSCVKQEGF
jgi:hypothetical protein